MKKFILTEEHLQSLETVIKPLQVLNQPIPSSIHTQICQIFNSCVELPEDDAKEEKSDKE